MQYGHFDNQSREYVIDRVDLPVSWTNYIGVGDMYGVFNHTAGGYLLYRSPEYHRITRFRPNGVPMHWGGDQQSQNEELRSQLHAGLSAAASSILFWGFDIAGFAGPLPTLDLYRRATQMACFCPIMQWHSEPDGGQFKELMPGGEGNNERSPWNLAAAYNTPEFVDEMRFWHKLRERLRPYLWETAQACVAGNMPMMRPLSFLWPEDEAALACEDEYMLGDALLVAPLLEENANTRQVYLPDGEWIGFFDRKPYQGKQMICTDCDGKIPVFIRSGYEKQF